MLSKGIEAKLVIGYMIGLFLLLLLRDVQGIAIHKMIMLVYCVLPMFFVSRDNFISILCFLFPLFWGLPGTYILIVAVIVLLLRDKKIDLRPLSLICLFTGLELFASMWYTSGDAISMFVDMAQYILSLAILTLLIYDEEIIDYQKCIQFFLIGSTILCVVVIAETIKNSPSNWLMLFSQGYFRIGDLQADETAGMQLKLNANSLAYYSLISICCGWVLLRNCENFISKVIIYICMAVCFIAGLFTVSRSWMLLLGVMIFLWGVNNLKTWKGIFLSLACFIGIIGSGIWVISTIPEISEAFITRFTSSTMDSGGGRVDIFWAYLQTFSENIRFILTGTGVLQYKEVTHLYDSMHNSLEQIVVCLGIPGAALFFWGLYYPVHNIISYKFNKIYWFPLISLVLFVQTIQFLNPMALMLPYVTAIFALKLGITEQDMEE